MAALIVCEYRHFTKIIYWATLQRSGQYILAIQNYVFLLYELYYNWKDYYSCLWTCICSL